MAWEAVSQGSWLCLLSFGPNEESKLSPRGHQRLHFILLVLRQHKWRNRNRIGEKQGMWAHLCFGKVTLIGAHYPKSFVQRSRGHGRDRNMALVRRALQTW